MSMSLVSSLDLNLRGKLWLIQILVDISVQILLHLGQQFSVIVLLANYILGQCQCSIHQLSVAGSPVDYPSLECILSCIPLPQHNAGNVL